MTERSIAVRLRIAALVAGAAFVSATPYMYYVSRVAFPDRVRDAFRALTPEKLLELDMVSVALVVVIASLVGSLFSERYGLTGLGDREQIRASLPIVLAAGPVLMIVSYFVFGRPLAERVPGYYPESLAWAAATVMKGAIFDEVVARYGMMTILSGIARRQTVANAMQALFFTAVGLKSMMFFGLPIGVSAFLVAGLLTSFFVHCVQGYVYARYGLLASMCLHFVLELKYVLHALLV